MTETQMLTMAAALVAAMFGLLCALIGWIGSRAINRLDVLGEAMTAMKDEIHDRITQHEKANAETFSFHERRVADQFISHDRRITKIEAKFDYNHIQAQD